MDDYFHVAKILCTIGQPDKAKHIDTRTHVIIHSSFAIIPQTVLKVYRTGRVEETIYANRINHFDDFVCHSITTHGPFLLHFLDVRRISH
jgi:hypothetical protein